METDILLDNHPGVHMDCIVAGYNCFVVQRAIFPNGLQPNFYFPTTNPDVLAFNDAELSEYFPQFISPFVPSCKIKSQQVRFAWCADLFDPCQTPQHVLVTTIL